jgi:ATP-dependent RNA helicase DeaD
VHRIGRVGRAGREGVAITLAEPRESRQLREIERATGRKIEVARVPTVADLRARRLDLTRAAVREALLSDDLDRFRVVVESLAGEFDIMQVALAAVKLAHRAEGGDDADAEEIPEPAPYRERPSRQGRAGRAPRGASGGGPREAGKSRRAPAGGGGRDARLTRLYIGAGRDAGVRPRDLVGAITGEAGIAGREVGAIDIADRFSLVEVSEDVAEGVIAALRASKIKGKKVAVRREGGGADR